MPDIEPGFEEQDLVGSTVHYNGSVALAGANLPSSDNKVISEVYVRNIGNNSSVNLLVSFDNGVGFATLKASESIMWSPKGKQKHIRVKSSSASVSAQYEVIINYEEY